jgi:aminocarboxymuconate-semialdehyde decarboxylase
MLVDVHTHIYLRRFVDLLKSRTDLPRIRSGRLFILDVDKTSNGRPIGSEYWDIHEKIAFMDKHRIDISVVSPANPWLDFLSPIPAYTLAKQLNDDLEHYCRSSPTLGRFFGFGLLPLVPGISINNLIEVIHDISISPHLKGVIIGTRGIGNGLDDDRLDPLWEAIQSSSLVVFIHPHYGVDSNAWGEKDNGHVLPLALGFPFETTTVSIFPPS